jgi:hypothetical protein
LETTKPATLAEAIDVASTQIRVDVTISASTSTATCPITVDKAATPSASSTTIVASTSTTAASATASDTSLADKMNDVLKHLRASRGGPTRGGFDRPAGNFQRSQPQFNGPCSQCSRCNSPQNNNNAAGTQQPYHRYPSSNAMQQQQPYNRYPYSARFSRPSSAPPKNLQCFKCGENHYARDCPNA